jgi:LuxR family transcriptional regulator, quorum-sensing system regulator CinR
MGTTTTKTLAIDDQLAAAFSIIEEGDDIDVVVARLRDFLAVDHIVYHSSKLGASPSVDPYIRLTYPAAWIKQYLQNNYVDVDPVLREGFKRMLPFRWSELTISTEQEMAFLQDALAHGVGPFGLSIPVIGKHGHRGLFSISFSGSEQEWETFTTERMPMLVEIANRIHQRIIRDVFGEDRPHLSARELEVLRWTALGKDAGEIAAILDISFHTTRGYLKSVRHKLDCVTSAQAVSRAIKLGLLKL